MRYILSLLLFIIVSNNVISQESLSLKQAISYTLENNINIQISKNNTEIATQQNTIGNAGYLPTLSANGSASYGVNNTTLQFLNSPEPTKITGAENSAYGAGLALNYKLFGGLGNFYTMKKLSLNEQNSTLQERLNIETNILQTIQAYCTVLQAQNNLEQVTTSLQISKERLNRAKTKNELSGGSKLELLNAEVDFNSDSVTYINAINNLEVSKFKLNQLMNIEFENYKVDELDKANEILLIDDLKQAAIENNASILVASYQTQISEKDLKITKSTMIPTLKLQSGYNFNHSENAASIVAFSESNGFSGSLQLSIPLFDGHKRNIQYQTAQINMKNAELNAINQEKILERDLNVAYSNYIKAKSIASLDVKTIETAQLNFDRSKELYANGQLTGIQFREAQNNLLKTKIMAENNAINVKLSEVELMRLSGQLIQ